MDMNADFRISHKSLLLPSLLIVVLTSSLFVCAFMMNGFSEASLTDAVHVKNETELKNIIDNTTNYKSTTIIIDNDVALTESLKISASKDITLTSIKATGFYKLIGASDKNTITVESGGTLKLEGTIVTHVNKVFGSGVFVSESGQLFMYGGEISGNSAIVEGNWASSSGLFSRGGGVLNYGVFELHGGKISNNVAGHGFGGGVYSGGTFKMFGGEISDNVVLESTSTGGYGGGVYNGGTFMLSGGTISGNTAADNGGGVYNYGSFERLGGVISGNTAAGRYGYDDVYLSNSGGSSNGGNGGGPPMWGDFSLRDVVLICVDVAIVVVGVVVAVLLFTFKKELRYTKEKTI
ncbi:MAG: hypothetical protein LBC12_00090 [Nitrososphaerota archaeon]|nr:hypothetical protein [Nitrososphaerota archaeon]